MHKPLSYLAIPILLAASGLGLHAEMRVTTADALKAAVNKTQPVYPMIAKQMKIAGQVNVEVTIATDGSVENVKVISGNAMLTRPWSMPLRNGSSRPSRRMARRTRRSRCSISALNSNF